MMQKMMLGTATLALSVMLGGCNGGQDMADATRSPADTAPSAAEPVQILNQVHGDDPALSDSTIRLIKTQDQLATLGVESLDQLDVNFDTQDVVLVALGEQPTGGYWVDITGVQFVGGVIYVQGLAGRPADDAMTTQQLTYPYAAAVIRETPATRALSDIESVVGSQPER